MYSRVSASTVSTSTTEPATPSERSRTNPARPVSSPPSESRDGGVQRTTRLPTASSSATTDTFAGADGGVRSASTVAPTKADRSLNSPLLSTAARR